MPIQNRRIKKTRKIISSDQLRGRKRLSRILTLVIICQIVIWVWLVGNYVWKVHRESIKSLPGISNVVGEEKKLLGGKIVSTEQPQNFDKVATEALIRQTDKAFALPVLNGMTKQQFSYTSTDARTNAEITVHGRIYVPNNGPSLPHRRSLFAFAPGTTGMGDQCAASLENVAKHNWANYDSLLAAYVSQGYVVVTTDYEGMRDVGRLHHYMIGEQEGRALLDAIRASENLSISKDEINKEQIVVAGYSQGGHAALWADKIREQYAKDIDLSAVVGFGPVSSINQTLADNIRGANINWFGPFLLTSYSDYYNKAYPTSSVLLSRWNTNLKSDVLGSCIDNVLKFWSTKPAEIYTPNFISAMQSNLKPSANIYRDFTSDMQANSITSLQTSSAKLINQGQLDNVILPSQSSALVTNLCAENSNITYRLYKSATHYNTMTLGFKDTLNWMNNVFNARSFDGNCGRPSLL